MNSQIALITGAARGLGATLVDTFVEAGFRVAATAREVPATAARHEVAWSPLDVLNAENCRSVIEAAISQFGRIDVLVNNASAYTAGTALHDLSPEAIARELDVTLRGVIYMSRAYVAAMRGRGSGTIISVGSTAGLPNEPGNALASVYAAAKAGVIRFAEVLQEEVGPLGIRSHVVIPGNMRDSLDEKALLAEGAVSYKAAARTILAMAEGADNLRLTRAELRPARPQ